MDGTGRRGEEEEKGAAAAMAGREPARDKTSFAATCSLLSQYLKENKGGLQGLGGLDMAPAAGKAATVLSRRVFFHAIRYSVQCQCHACTIKASREHESLCTTKLESRLPMNNTVSLIRLAHRRRRSRSFQAADHHELAVSARRAGRGAPREGHRRGAKRP